MNGSLTASGMTIRPAALDTTFGDGSARISFDGGRIRLEELRFSSGRGRVRASGDLSLDSGKPSDLNFQVNARNLALQREEFFQVVISQANATVRSTAEGITTSGEVQLGRSELTRNLEPQSFSRAARQLSQPPGEGTAVSAVALNVRVRGGDQLWINNNVARLRLGADLEIGGTVGAPSVRGRVRSEEGYVVFLDRRFDVTSASVTFNNNVDAAVRLNAVSVVPVTGTPAESYSVFMAVTGSVASPVVRLSSNPSLNPSDIYSLLVLGRPGSELGGGAGGAVASRAGEIATERLSAIVSRNLTGFLGLQELSVQGNAFDVGDQWNPRVRATTRIFDWLTITYETDARSLEQNDVEVDVRLNRNLSLEGRVDDQGNTSVNLKVGITLP
jgi:autotransporter translocation and assembly factor TamB